jgi:hypothetical protein
MGRDWFELRCEAGVPAYVHSRTRQSVERAPGTGPSEWALSRAAFFTRFPRVSLIKRTGCGTPIGTVECVPCGPVPVFEPGDVLAIPYDTRREPEPVRVVAVQMPLPTCGTEASYLLEDGTMVCWSDRDEAWLTRRGHEVAIGAVRLPKRPRRRKSR